MEIRNKKISENIYEILPPRLKNLVSEYSGRERDNLLLATIVATSAVLPNYYSFYDGDFIFPNLYLMIVAPPASGKGVIGNALKVVDPIHSYIRDQRSSNYECLKIPGNVSSAMFYEHLRASPKGALLFESEADTLSNMFKQEWGDFSDVLRKAFHHETLSLSRKSDNQFYEIEQPKLSLVLSGTPGQVKSLVGSKENGLMSRFLFYTYEEDRKFKDVFHIKARKLATRFEVFGIRFLENYKLMTEKEHPIEFHYTDTQKEMFLTKMEETLSHIQLNYPAIFEANMFRHALAMVKISMVITAFRHPLGCMDESKIYCNDEDFYISIELFRLLLHHAYVILDNNNSLGLTELEEQLYDSLGYMFLRSTAVEKGTRLGFSKRTVDDKLKVWQQKKIIKKVVKGKYKKIG